MELRWENDKVGSNAGLSRIKEFPSNDALSRSRQIHVVFNKARAFSSQLEKNWRKSCCPSFGVEAPNLLPASVAEKFKWKIEEGFPGCCSARDGGGVAGIEYGSDEVANEGGGFRGVFRRFKNHTVPSCDRRDQGTQGKLQGIIPRGCDQDPAEGLSPYFTAGWPEIERVRYPSRLLPAFEVFQAMAKLAAEKVNFCEPSLE